eukprot:scaffold248986_cov39-Attheya_sp.AAC.1
MSCTNCPYQADASRRHRLLRASHVTVNSAHRKRVQPGTETSVLRMGCTFLQRYSPRLLDDNSLRCKKNKSNKAESGNGDEAGERRQIEDDNKIISSEQPHTS